jgi:hypothetical protein
MNNDVIRELEKMVKVARNAGFYCYAEPMEKALLSLRSID